MRCGVHPLLLYAFGSAAHGDVLGDYAEMRPSLSGAGLQVRFAGELMRERVLVEHFLRVGLRGSSERRVPVQRLETLVKAGLVGKIQELLLPVIWELLGLRC